MVVGFTTTCAISAHHFKHFVSFLDFTKKSWMGTNNIVPTLYFNFNLGLSIPNIEMRQKRLEIDI
jgi:hypothetical protein